MNDILWACELEQWTCEHGQVNPNESFKEYLVDVDGILFDTWDWIFSDVEEYFTTCHGWMILLDEKKINIMDELSNERWQQNCFCKNLNKRNKME
jgi:hypothetical protein